MHVRHLNRITRDSWKREVKKNRVKRKKGTRRENFYCDAECPYCNHGHTAHKRSFDHARQFVQELRR